MESLDCYICGNVISFMSRIVCIILSIFYCANYDDYDILTIIVLNIIFLTISIIFDGLVCIKLKNCISLSSSTLFVIYCGLTFSIFYVGGKKVTDNINLITIGIMLGIITFEQLVTLCYLCIKKNTEMSNV